VTAYKITRKMRTCDAPALARWIMVDRLPAEARDRRTTLQYFPVLYVQLIISAGHQLPMFNNNIIMYMYRDPRYQLPRDTRSDPRVTTNFDNNNNSNKIVVIINYILWHVCISFCFWGGFSDQIVTENVLLNTLLLFMYINY